MDPDKFFSHPVHPNILTALLVIATILVSTTIAQQRDGQFGWCLNGAADPALEVNEPSS